MGQFGSCIVIARSGYVQAPFWCAQTHYYWAKPIKGVACEADWPTVFSWIYSYHIPLAQFCRNAARSFIMDVNGAVGISLSPPLSHPLRATVVMCNVSKWFGSGKLVAAVRWPHSCQQAAWFEVTCQQTALQAFSVCHGILICSRCVRCTMGF